LALCYTDATFVLVAVATDLLYSVLIANVDREDDQFLVDTVQIRRGLIRERPTDIAALKQEVDWEGTARRYARVYAGSSSQSSVQS
jgi:two-component system heavy metal sensor histidine kinase CusS